MTGGNKADPKVVEEMQRLGATEQQIADYQTKQQKDCLVYPWHWNAFKAFLQAETQWAVDNNGRPTGLDYSRAKVAWDLHKMTLSPLDFERVQSIEIAVLELFNEKS